MRFRRKGDVFMGNTVLHRSCAHQLDFYLPLNAASLLANGNDLHVHLTLVPYEIVQLTHADHRLLEVVTAGLLGNYRYTAVFPSTDWRRLNIDDVIDLQQEAVQRIADRHNVDLRYVGPLVQHRLRSGNCMDVTDDLPIFDQYHDPDQYRSWKLCMEPQSDNTCLFIPHQPRKTKCN